MGTSVHAFEPSFLYAYRCLPAHRFLLAAKLVLAVAFTGAPDAADDRFLVNAQVGAWDVVSGEPGVTPEVDRLSISESGDVIGIGRVSESSQVEAGEVVLSDARLGELGAALWWIQRVFPVDASAPEGAEVMLDTEWKVLADGRLVVKQVRPFLRR